jgi:hypoxanthine phosphoribosyltransferase
MNDQSLPPVTDLSWDEFDEHCVSLADKLRATGKTFDMIIALQRGGCVTGVVLSHLLGISSFQALGIRTTSNEEIRSTRLTPVIYGESVLEIVRGKSILLLDDVCNTGLTLRTAESHVSKFGPLQITTGVTIWDGDGSQPCHADHFGFYTPGWVVFPWERQRPVK